MDRYLRIPAALALAVPLLGGCFGNLKSATATFEGIKQPILLGPVDRIGGGTKLAAHKVGEYDGKAMALLTNDGNGGGTDAVNNLTIYVDAVKALARGGGDDDIRVTKVRTWAIGYLSFVKNTVLIEGDVVRMGGAQ